MNAQELDRRIARHMARQRGAFRGKLIMQQAAGRVPRVQVRALATELLQQVELFQHFGLATRPPGGSDLILIPIGGKTGHCVAVASEHPAIREIIGELVEGESVLYNRHGDRVSIKNGRIIEFKAQSEVVVNAPLARCKGNLLVEGNIAATGSVSDATGSIAAMRATFDAHTHLNGGLPLASSATPLPLMGAVP